jgi:hypothetical protein
MPMHHKRGLLDGIPVVARLEALTGVPIWPRCARRLRLLLDKRIRYVAGHGTQRMTALALPENAAMRKLVVNTVFTVDAAASDEDCLRYVLPLGEDPSPAINR